LQLTSPLRGCPYPQLKAAYLGCTLAEFTLALTGYPVTWFLWHFTATQNPVGFFGRRQVALPRLTPGAVLRQMPNWHLVCVSRLSSTAQFITARQRLPVIVHFCLMVT